MPIQGFCSDAFLPFKEAYEKNFLEGLEIGSSLAAYHRGDLVMSLWGGRKTSDRSEKFEEDTIVQNFSVGKIAAAMATLKVIDAGLVELDKPIATYWPEFGQHGKDEITVREALTHRALVPGLSEPQPAEVRADWKKWTSLIAMEKPWFDRGVACYHPLHYGVILAEIVQRTTGEPFDDWFRKEITGPSNIDFQFTLPNKADHGRFSLPNPTRNLPFEENSLEDRVFSSFDGELPNLVQAMMVSPGGSGFASASGLAALGSILSQRGISQGVRILSESIVEEALKEQFHGHCHCIGELRYGLGIGLASEKLLGFKYPGPDTAMWGGFGGQFLFVDPTTEVAVGYATNLLLIDDFDGENWTGPQSDRQNRVFDAYAEVSRAIG
jgi:CubicO group peptidase (beta-lactamase class C family)